MAEKLGLKALKNAARIHEQPLRAFVRSLLTGTFKVTDEEFPERNEQLRQAAGKWAEIKRMYVEDAARNLAADLVVTNDRKMQGERDRNDLATKKPALAAAGGAVRKLWSTAPPRRGVAVTKSRAA
jgi:hypothetical protein